MKWITRENVKVDRVACPWLIRRFIDPQAEFLFVPEEQVLALAAQHEAVPFDMPRNPELKFTHHDGLCTFEVLIRECKLEDAALHRLARIVHGADIRGEEHAAPEAPGLKAHRGRVRRAGHRRRTAPEPWFSCVRCAVRVVPKTCRGSLGGGA